MSKMQNSASYSLSLTFRLTRSESSFATVAAAIQSTDAELVLSSRVAKESNTDTFSVVLYCSSIDHQKVVLDHLGRVAGLTLVSGEDLTFSVHREGKLDIQSRYPLKNADDLAMTYTPGVGRVCMAIHDDVNLSHACTIRSNTVAVVSDGTAVLGLGDIGPEAALPVMEGKAVLFKTFGGLNAFPICINTKDVDEIVDFVEKIAPTFGGINLEDISAPRCFEIEDRLKASLDIPVFHDDQHGTAVVTLAALMNALELVGKKPGDLKVVFSGVGAAGVACSKILLEYGVTNIIGCDRTGAIYEGRPGNMNFMKDWYATHTNPEKVCGTLKEVMRGADVFVGLSGPGVIDVEDLLAMNESPIVFAMANPIPEIMPEVAAPHTAVMATGRSDYPNQINNVLAFPGIFRGALACRAKSITEGMKVAAAKAIAALAKADGLEPGRIIPSPFDPRVSSAVADAVKTCALEEGVTRAEPVWPSPGSQVR